MKVFISFSTKDLQIAQRLYGDLVAGGADVYEFGKSETAGVSAWKQVVAWIHDADAFVLLLSKSALESTPVDGEIDHATWSHYNSQARKPAKLISAFLQSDVSPPALMKPYATLDLKDYDSGISRLLNELGLKSLLLRKTFGLVPALPTLSPAFANLVPEPSPATTWSRSAKKLLRTYDLVKPSSLTPEQETSHLDMLLAGKPSQFDSLFFGQRAKRRAAAVFPSLTDQLVSFDLTTFNTPLQAPTLSLVAEGTLINTLSWNEVDDAVAYVLEESLDEEFITVSEKSHGPATEYHPRTRPITRYYRVRATGGVFRSDSPWSEPVVLTGQTGQTDQLWIPKSLRTNFGGLFNYGQLDAPVLTHEEDALIWTPVDGAARYVLEEGSNGAFETPQILFDGEATRYDRPTPGKNFRRYIAFMSIGSCYRVKAVSAIRLDSPWSNVVSKLAPF